MPKVYEPDDENAAFNVALSRLTMQMRTMTQIRKTLSRKGFYEPTIEKVIGRLDETGLLDDAQYAARMVELQQRRGGRRRIEHKLWAHGIDQQTAQEALSVITDEDESDRAVELAEHWLRSMEDMPLRQRKQRVYQRLARRGFTYDNINDAFRRLDMQEDGDE